MKKHGFTLAEVLITLSIVGVVAALTMPALMQNVGGAKIGPQLAKFVSSFETATEALMLEENISSLESLTKAVATGTTYDYDKEDNITTYSSVFLNHLSKHLIMTVAADSEGNPSSIADAYLSTAENHPTTDTFVLKDGTAIQYRSYDKAIFAGKDSYKGIYGYIYVNIAGLPSENSTAKARPGKEVFVFYVDNNGTLVPYGSRAHKYLTDKFVASCNPSGSTVEKYACTGAFADNKWKAPKNY